jgi:hypothetical protein
MHNGFHIEEYHAQRPDGRKRLGETPWRLVQSEKSMCLEAGHMGKARHPEPCSFFSHCLEEQLKSQNVKIIHSKSIS